MFDGDMGGALVESAERHADRPALWAAGQQRTYTELFDVAASIAGAISAAGIAPGEGVAILSRRTPTVYAGILGALIAGCSYTPLNAQFPRERNQAMLRRSGAAALILDEDAAAKLDDFLDPLPADLVVIRPEAGDGADGIGGRSSALAAGSGPAFWRSVRRPVDRENIAYILFTSGTTGMPKGVPITHSNVAAYLEGLMRLGPLHSGDRLLQMTKLTFDLSAHDMFLSWLNGSQTFSMPDNADLLAPRLIRQYGLTSCLIVPSAAALMLEQGLAKPGGLPSLRLSYFCGEALPRSVAAGWSEVAPNARIINLYGPTECTIAFTFYEVHGNEANELPVVPIGRPLGDQMAAILSPDMTEVEPGESGQICLGGSQVTTGYMNEPAMNAEKFATVDGVRWYKTGDVGRWVEPHGILFCGRFDRQVKIRGYRVELQEIEGAVRRVTGKHEVAVIPWPVEATGRADGSVAFICGDEVDPSAIRTGCRAIVADYMVPDRIVFLPELPKNSNGKVDYNALARHPSLVS